MDVILDRGSTPLTSRKEKGSHGEPFAFVIPATERESPMNCSAEFRFLSLRYYLVTVN